MAGRVAGIIELKVDGTVLKAKGAFTYNYGAPTREAVVGSDTIHGYKESVTVPSVEGAITDVGDLDVISISRITNATVTLRLGNNKIFVLRNAWSVNPDGLSGDTDEGELSVRFEGESAEEVRV